MSFAAAATPLHRRPTALALVALGGATGAASRYLLSHNWPQHGQLAWPVLAINCAGAFVLGVLLEALTQHGPDQGVRQKMRLLVGTGFCGAFTTYSTFAHDLTTLGQRRPALSTIWGLGEVSLGFICALIGVWLGARWGKINSVGEDA